MHAVGAPEGDDLTRAMTGPLVASTAVREPEVKDLAGFRQRQRRRPRLIRKGIERADFVVLPHDPAPPFPFSHPRIDSAWAASCSRSRTGWSRARAPLRLRGARPTPPRPRPPRWPPILQAPASASSAEAFISSIPFIDCTSLTRLALLETPTRRCNRPQSSPQLPDAASACRRRPSQSARLQARRPAIRPSRRLKLLVAVDSLTVQ